MATVFSFFVTRTGITSSPANTIIDVWRWLYAESQNPHTIVFADIDSAAVTVEGWVNVTVGVVVALCVSVKVCVGINVIITVIVNVHVTGTAVAVGPVAAAIGPVAAAIGPAVGAKSFANRAAKAFHDAGLDIRR
jgi:hypothetical protein